MNRFIDELPREVEPGQDALARGRTVAALADRASALAGVPAC